MEAIIVDLSHTLEENIQIYPGDPSFVCKQVCTVQKDGYSVHALSLGSHTGTHVDAPSHFVSGGKNIDELPLALFVGSVVLVDLPDLAPRARITWSDIQPYEHQMGPGKIVLVRTGWSRHWGTRAYYDHPFLTRDVAGRIMGTGVRVIGVDALSPDETHLEEGEEGDWGAHETVLGAGGVIAENLKGLEALREGSWVVHVVPLNLACVDGSPVRAYAVRQT